MSADELLDFNPTQVYHKVVQAGELWAEKKAEAQHLEEVGKILLAKITKDLCTRMSATQAKEEAKSDPQWKTHIDGLKVAQEQALRAQVQYEGAKGWRDDFRTKVVTLRDVAKQL